MVFLWNVLTGSGEGHWIELLAKFGSKDYQGRQMDHHSFVLRKLVTIHLRLVLDFPLASWATVVPEEELLTLFYIAMVRY